MKKKTTIRLAIVAAIVLVIGFFAFNPAIADKLISEFSGNKPVATEVVNSESGQSK